jgi:HEAT repeat protein
MASCPTCNKDVDPLRAPSARVIGGRVVAFCSAACAAEGAAAGATAAKARAGAADPPAGGSAASSLAQIKQTGRVVRQDEPSEVGRARPLKITSPIDNDDVVEEHVVPRRARTEPPTPPPGRRRGRRGLVLMFAGAIVIGGMAIAIVQAVSPSSPGPARAVPDSSRAEKRTDAAKPEPVDHTAVARRVLTELLDGESDRVRRLAAVALARTGDPDAITALAALLAAETSDITRLDIAYALGRAGDARGFAALTAATKSTRRDVRADAARMLVLLGDPGGAGAKVLGSFIEIRTHRLGAAEALARIADPKAIAALQAIHADETAAADDRIRAAIALGRAGRPEVAAELRGLLGDGRFNAFAAAALAELGDASAREVLVKQLGVPSLRVGSAVALRRLEPKLDPEPLVRELATALAADKDVARVTAAEAMLVLTGPATWSEHD